MSGWVMRLIEQSGYLGVAFLMVGLFVFLIVLILLLGFGAGLTAGLFIGR